MNREAIHHHDVAVFEGGNETSFEIGYEGCCIQELLASDALTFAESCDGSTVAMYGLVVTV